MKLRFSHLLSLILLVTASWVQATQITGRLLSDSGNPIVNAEISVKSIKVQSDQSGTFSLKLKKSDIHQLNIEAPGFYPSIQTFSDYELNQPNANNLGDITLVKKSEDRVMLAFGGDVMMGRRYYKPYFGDEVLIEDSSRLQDSKSIVEHIKPYMSLADIAAINLETQIADNKPTERAPKSVTFYSKPETLAALKWAGIDYVTLGNNHTYDYLDSGLKSTLQFLKQADMPFSGAGLNQQQALQAYNTDINNNKLSLLGFVGWEGNFTPTQTADADKGGAAFGSTENILNTVKQAVNQNRSAIVQYHGSQEYANRPTNVTEHRLKAALDAGAALAIAHHPHVAQGLELYQNKLIAYSMGNFIFDQFFSSTPHSFILYVWLDKGEFHRAEIVPIYLKGYKPTPATGMHRFNILKRLAVLSAERNTVIERSGGHGVINRNASQFEDAEIETSHKIAGKEQLLFNIPWQHMIKGVSLKNIDSRYRLGTNLLNGSDFESFNTFHSRERGWIYEPEFHQLSNKAYSGNYSMLVNVPEGKATPVGMQAFRRVYNASSPMTVSAKIKTDKPITAKIYWQGRKRSQKLFEALNNGKKHLVATQTFNGNENWQSLSIDLNSPRVGYRSFRLFVELEHQGESSQQLLIDDFSAIEWQTPFSSGQPLLITHDDKQVSYIGFEKAVEGEIKISYQ